MVSKPVVVSGLFGIAHFYDLVVVKVQGLGIELPVGNRDTFWVIFFPPFLSKGVLWGRECGVDFGVSSKFQGVDSNLLKLKSVKLPSSSFQNCQNLNLLAPFFFIRISVATVVSKFWSLKMWIKTVSKIRASKIRMSRSWWRCCDKICWKPSCRLVMDDSSDCWLRITYLVAEMKMLAAWTRC